MLRFVLWVWAWCFSLFRYVQYTSTHDEVSGAAGSERVDQWLLLQVIVDEGAR